MRTLLKFGTNNLYVATFLLFLIPISSSPVIAGPEQFIRMVGEEAINALTDKKISNQIRKTRFRKILNRSFEVKFIARFALGRYWRRANKNQLSEYTYLFEEFIVQSYANLFKDYSGETFNVLKVRGINEIDQLVQSEIFLKDGRKIRVSWRVRGNETFKIVDVMIEGVSMALTQRDEFAAIISQNNGKIEGLLSALRLKSTR